MKVNWDGREYDFDWKTVMVKQGIVIHLAHGITISEYLQGLTKSDPRALQSAYWLMLQQAGIIKPIADCDFDAIAFAEAILKGIAAEEEAEAAQPEPEPVPTSPPPGEAASPTSATPTDTTPPLIVPSVIPVPTGS